MIWRGVYVPSMHLDQGAWWCSWELMDEIVGGRLVGGGQPRESEGKACHDGG